MLTSLQNMTSWWPQPPSPPLMAAYGNWSSKLRGRLLHQDVGLLLHNGWNMQTHFQSFSFKGSSPKHSFMCMEGVVFKRGLLKGNQEYVDVEAFSNNDIGLFLDVLAGPTQSPQLCSYLLSGWWICRIIWQHLTYGKLLLSHRGLHHDVCNSDATNVGHQQFCVSILPPNSPTEPRGKQVDWKVTCAFGWPFLTKWVNVGLRNHKGIEWFCIWFGAAP